MIGLFSIFLERGGNNVKKEVTFTNCCQQGCGRTYLHFAARNLNYCAVRFFTEDMEVDVFAKDKDGLMAIDIARNYGCNNQDIVAYLERKMA